MTVQTQFDFLAKDAIRPEQSAQRPDFAEKRLAMAMIKDVIGELDRWASGDRRKKSIMDDAIAWVRGETDCKFTFAIVCLLLGWDESSVKKALLARLTVKKHNENVVVYQESRAHKRERKSRYIVPWRRVKGGPASEGQPGDGDQSAVSCGIPEHGPV